MQSYRDLLAVDHVSFEVRPGEIVGLVGPNGAGKTTTINMILGVLAPTSGQIRIAGIDLAARRSARPGPHQLRRHLRPPARQSDRRAELAGIRHDLRRAATSREQIETLVGEYDLQRLRKTKCGVLSSGEQTRVTLAKAMLNQPRLLLLDEPTASIDPATAREMRARITRFASETGGAVLWTSHNMYEVAEVCDRVLFLSHGRVLLSGEPAALIAEHGDANLEDLFVRVAQRVAAGGGARLDLVMQLHPGHRAAPSSTCCAAAPSGCCR